MDTGLVVQREPSTLHPRMVLFLPYQPVLLSISIIAGTRSLGGRTLGGSLELDVELLPVHIL